MKEEEQDQLLRAIERATSPTLKLTEHITLVPQLPTTVEALRDPLTQVGGELKFTAPLGKSTTLALDVQESNVHLTLRKKF